MKEETKQRRDELKALSKIAAKLVEQGVAEGINDGLHKIYQQQGHTELNTYRQWQAKGYQVRKGSKALLLWGQPVEKKRETANGEAKPDGEEDKSDFWPLAYLFSNLQVDPIQQQ